MFCRMCGRQMETDSVFCGHCGVKKVDQIPAGKPPGNLTDEAKVMPDALPADEHGLAEHVQESRKNQGKRNKTKIVLVVAACVLALVLVVTAILVLGTGKAVGRGPEQTATMFLEAYREQDQDQLMRILHPERKKYVESRQQHRPSEQNYFAVYPLLLSYEIVETEIYQGDDFQDMLDSLDHQAYGFTGADPTEVVAIASVFAEAEMKRDDRTFTTEVEVLVVQVDGRWYYFMMY